jgi:hypothetical protein
VRSRERVYIFVYAVTFTFKSSLQQPDDGPDRHQNMYLHHHKYAVVLNWKYKVIFMFINNNTKYTYCELSEMPELHTITDILHRGVWSQLQLRENQTTDNHSYSFHSIWVHESQIYD